MMGACVSKIIEIVNEIAPFSLSETWDNSGLQAGNPLWPVNKILVALDVSMAALDHAAAHQCDLIISHHPLVMAPEKTMDFSRMPGSAVCFCAQNQIAILSAHTNLDKAEQGLNDFFAQKIGIQALGAFCPEVGDGDSPSHAGIGRTGKLEAPVTVKELAQQIKQRLDIQNLRVAGDLDSPVQDIALCTGSGGSLTRQFLQSSAQVYITGDLKYHEARDIESQGRAAIDVGHFASEHIVVELLKTRLEKRFSDSGLQIEVLGYHKEKDPFITL